MIIIIEGPDGSGKSTVAKQLNVAISNSRIIHFGAPVNDAEAFSYYKKYAAEIVNAKPNETLIFDRSWYSDMVYGPIMRNREEMPDVTAKMLEALVTIHGGGMVIYCTGHLSTLWARCKTRGESYIPTIECLGLISDSYKQLFETQCGLPVIKNITTR
jgi:thymidylate kinase